MSSRRKQNVTGQVSFFDLGQPAQALGNQDTFPLLREYPLRELLAQEKEMTGVYCSAHPLDEYAPLLDRLPVNTAYLNELSSKQLEEANALIEEMKKATKGQGDLQQKITAYDQQVAQLQKELEQTKIEAEIRVGLLAEKALDVDYLTFKLKEKGELKLDENGRISGWDDKVAALKTQLPNQFETAAKRKIIENPLPDQGGSGGDAEPKDLADAIRQQYEKHNE